MAPTPLKAVLPAILKSSEFLRNKYSKTIGEIGLSSLNFKESHIWLDLENEKPDLYKSLPKLLRNGLKKILKTLFRKWMVLQMVVQPLLLIPNYNLRIWKTESVNELIDKLLRYCELDTLAMVMLYEHFVEIIFDGDLVVLKLIL